MHSPALHNHYYRRWTDLDQRPETTVQICVILQVDYDFNLGVQLMLS